MFKMICLVDERISEKCERSLLLRGARVIKLPPAEKLPVPMASHPDMLLFLHNNRIITSAEYCERFSYIFSDIRELSSAVEFTFTSDSFSDKYPNDAIFNALVIENRIFLKKDSVSESVLSYAKANGLDVISTRQGYPACTTLAFGGAAITADEGMAKKLSSSGIRVTLIENGDISLPPYEYGFIGGAAGVFGNGVYFLGDVSTHRDGKKICDAIRAEGFIPISLSDEPLADLGRILFID